MKSSRPQSPTEQSQASLGDLPLFFTTDRVASGVPGSFNDEVAIRSIITESIRNCGKSREVIAEEMTYLLGAVVTRRALDSYTSAAEQQNRFPAQYMRAFCAVTGEATLIRYVIERSGLHTITPEQQKLLEIGRLYLRQKRAADSLSHLEAQVPDGEL